MILRKGWVAGVVGVGLLAGCGDGGRPPSATGDGGLMLSNPDTGAITLSDAGGGLDLVLVSDGPPLDFGTPPDVQAVDRPVTPADATADSGTPVDVPEDVSLVVDTGADAGSRRLRTLCGFTQNEMVRLAVRAATCLHEPPQRLLEQMYRPSWWADGVLPRRSCAVLRDALMGNTGCGGFLGLSLKIRVEPTVTGTCASEIVGCRAGEPGHQLTTICRNGYTISEDCETVTGTPRCVASTTAVACEPQPLDTAMCTESSPARCHNGRVQRCVGGAYVNGPDCDTSLTTCDATAGACVGSGAACTTDVDTCNGTSLQQCRGGRLHSTNCGFLVTGSSCRTVGGHSFCGTASDCDPASAPADGTCEGGTLTLCAGGVAERINCAAAGFVGCGAGGCTQ